MTKALIESHVLADFGRRTPSQAELAIEPLPVFPRNAYAATTAISEPCKCLDDIKKPAKNGVPLNSLSKHIVPVALSLMLEVKKTGKRDILAKVWYSLLPQRKDIIVHPSIAACYLVLHQTRFGTCVCPCRLRDLPGTRSKEVIWEALKPCWLHIADHREWKACSTVMVPPVGEIANQRPPRIVVTSNTQFPLMERVARCGLFQVTPPYIDKLLRIHVLSKDATLRRPPTLIERVILFIVKTCPRISTAEIHEAIAWRDVKVGSTPLFDLASDFADSIYESGDTKDMREFQEAQKAVEKAGIYRDCVKQGSKYLEILGHAPVALPPVAVTVPKTRAKTSVNWSQILRSDAQLKKLLPQLKHCVVQPVPLKSSYTCYYPGVAPGSRTRTYGAKFSKLAVIKHCLKWAWTHHTNRTGEECFFRL